MADIDKSLPNQKTTVKLPGEEEIEEAIQEQRQNRWLYR